MPLEAGIFIEPPASSSSTSCSATPDLSLHISPPSTSSTSSLICSNTNNNYEARHYIPSSSLSLSCPH
ncbi:hypothetical protein K1719_024261 [Acacia pycnantha]|nr:hypothetical protein K1719_024261 [Acacia pycnantha]